MKKRKEIIKGGSRNEKVGMLGLDDCQSLSRPKSLVKSVQRFSNHWAYGGQMISALGLLLCLDSSSHTAGTSEVAQRSLLIQQESPGGSIVPRQQLQRAAH